MSVAMFTDGNPQFPSNSVGAKIDWPFRSGRPEQSLWMRTWGMPGTASGRCI